MNQHRPASSQAFTLIELLVVIAIIAILAALLFPVFAAARGKARQTVCSSNLRQMGLATSMYSQDYDGLYPYGIDPADRDTPQMWSAFPQFQALLPSLPYVHELLQPYVKSKEIFHCPSDTGIVIEDFTGYVLNCVPTCYAKRGTSYFYRTEIPVKGAGEANFQTPAQLNVYMDGSGLWHGSGPSDISIGVGRFYPANQDLQGRRFSTLHADGHVKSLSFAELWTEWSMPL